MPRRRGQRPKAERVLAESQKKIGFLGTPYSVPPHNFPHRPPRALKKIKPYNLLFLYLPSFEDILPNPTCLVFFLLHLLNRHHGRRKDEGNGPLRGSLLQQVCSTLFWSLKPFKY